MQFAKRIFMFLAVNLAVMLMLGIVFSLLVAFFPGLRESGLGPTFVLAGVFGFGGALVSWMMSRTFAKWFSGVQLIDPNTHDSDARWLLQTVKRLAEKSGITEMPEVGIYHSPEINAFCTGPTKNSSLVAVSTGLLQRMSKDELEGVLAHEISHAGNGDMVTMTLVSGVVNTIVLFLTFIITNIINSQLRRNDDDGPGFMDFIVRQIIFTTVQGVLGLIASVAIVFPFSRWREYRADAGGAQLVGKAKMIAALQALADNFRLPQAAVSAASDPSMAAMKMSALTKGSLFSTHPELEDRIARLKQLQGVF